MKTKRYFLGIVFLFGCVSQTLAQTIQTEQEKFDMYRQQVEHEYSMFKKQSAETYQQFRDSVNQVYADFLEKAWDEFDKRPAIPRPKDEEIEPLPMPKEDRNKSFEERPILIDEVVMPMPTPPQPVPIAPIPKIEEPQEKWVEFSVFGTAMKVRFGVEQQFSIQTLNEHGIAETWRKLSKETYNNLIRDCLSLRLHHQLCDWAYLKMLEQVGKACMGETNEATMLAAFIFCQSGYQMRLGMSRNRLYLLYATDYSIYDLGCFLIDDIFYYVLAQDEPSRMTICQATFPKERALALTVPQEQHFDMLASNTRELKSLNHPDVRCSVQVNKNLLDFYSSYPSSEVGGNPMTCWAMYANTPLQSSIKEQLYPALRKHIEGKNELEAIGVLLDFVQMSLVYGYDEKVWGHERAFFAEETLYYPFADCEDRSILFSRLVRDLVGLKVVLVFYPGHLATAVQFTSPVPGDYLMLDGKRFTVCDPTYFNAGVGRTMPGMDNKTAKVILLNN